MSGGERKVWVVTMPMGWSVEPGTQVLIEQFGDDPPSIAFRAHSIDSWGPPFDSEER